MAANFRRRRAGLIALYVGLPALLISTGSVAWMMAVEKSTLVLQSADSPDGHYRAEVVREDPGVSSGFEYMVRVMPTGLSAFATSLRKLPFDPVYIALDAHHEPDWLNVQWTSLHEVTIRCTGCSDAQIGREHFREVSMKYELR
jgi:hypothetical protein